MIRVGVAAFILGISLAGLAQAQIVPATDAPSSTPCVRGQSQMKIAGLGIDEMKCELAVLRSERDLAQRRLESAVVTATLAANDLAALAAERSKHDANLREWFKGWFGEPAPVAK